MSKIVCNIEETVCTPSSNPTVTGAYIRCNIDDPTCIESTPTEGGGAAAPTYNLSGPSSINESESGTFTVATTGVDEGLLIPYTLTGVQSADIVGGSLTGTFEIDANGAGSVTIQMVEDFVAEGETMVMTIGSALNPLDFINVSIVDTSYSLAASPAQTMVEGNSLSFNLTTTGISDGQTRNWDITGSGHSLSATSGTFTVNSNAASVSISSVYDALYQGTSNFTFRVFGSDGVTVADTINFTVTDAASTYSQSSASAFDEGTSLAVTVSTTNVQDATTLYWTVNHGTTATADFTAESGSFTVTSNSGSFNVDAVADSSTEGAETFTIEIRTGSIAGPIVNTSSTITINDTSIHATITNEFYLIKDNTGTITSQRGIDSNYTIGSGTTHALDTDWAVGFWFKSDTDYTGLSITPNTYLNALFLVSSSTQAAGGNWFEGFNVNVVDTTMSINWTHSSSIYTGYQITNVNNSIFDGQWHHLLFQHDTNGGQYTGAISWLGNMTLYLDGVAHSKPTALSSGSSANAGQTTSTTPYIGKGTTSGWSNATNQRSVLWEGGVDEVAVWTNALSQQQINYIYNSGYPENDLKGNTSNVPQPQVWYRFEDNANLNKDTISTNNTGTINACIQNSLSSSDTIYVPASGSWSNTYYYSVTQTQNAGYVESETISHDFLSDFSMSFWVKFAGNLNQAYTNAFYFGARAGTSRDWASRFVGVAIQYRGNASNYFDVLGTYVQFSDPVMDDGDWHHVVITYDSTGVSGTDTFSATDIQNKFTLYVDGSTPTWGGSGGSSSLTASTQLTEFRVGDFASSYTEPNFDVDEFAYWGSTKLTSTEVGLMYNSGVPTDLQNTSNVTVPTRYWRYEDNNNLTKDTISDSNQGTVDNGTQTAY
jgi:hypothetical protein